MGESATINERVWEFLLSGGVFMAFILLCSFVAITVSIYRAMTIRWDAIVPRFLDEEWSRCDQYFREGKAAKFLSALRQSDTVFGRIGTVALSPEYRNRDEASEAVEATAKEQIVKLQAGMGVLEVVITIAPLLGLLGTVSGLVSVFGNLGEAGEVSDHSLIAGGIAKALNTTIAGLVVAVITVIIHSWFTRKLENMAARLEVMASQLIHKFYKHGGPALFEEPKAPVDVEGAQKLEEAGREIGSSEFLSP